MIQCSSPGQDPLKMVSCSLQFYFRKKKIKYVDNLPILYTESPQNPFSPENDINLYDLILFHTTLFCFLVVNYVYQMLIGEFKIYNLTQ